MTAYITLLRAVNVGGTGKLPMTELAAMCEACGFAQVKTYIASGNVVFTSDKTEAQVQAALSEKLEAYAGKPVGVLVRNAKEMAQVLADNPFEGRAANRTMAIFLSDPPPRDTLETIRYKADEEELRLGKREIYVFYGDGMAHSKLVIPAAKTGTARNMNTVAKLAEMAAAL